MGTPSDPYDATRNGPLCPSAGTTAEDADRIRGTNITDAIVNLAEGSLVKMTLDFTKIGRFITEYDLSSRCNITMWDTIRFLISMSHIHTDQHRDKWT